ncbi:MAG: right-handed parallel beta-helix repeat-containing protein [Bacteroidales bacterium]
MQFIKRYGGFFLLLFLIPSFFNFSACRKEEPTYDKSQVRLIFSQDTVKFDTIFTTLYTITKRITVKNPSKNAIKISNIHLEGGFSSRFRINVNGDTSMVVHNVIVAAKDSFFIFVKAAINYQDKNNPIEIIDHIVLEMDQETHQKIVLVAWGQDAHYWQSNLIHKIPYPNTLSPNKIDTLYMPYFYWDPKNTLNSEKPYIIYGYLTVRPGDVLKIPAGVKIYFAPNSGIWVQNQGSLQINGTLTQAVRMQGIRLDADYKNEAGQWGRIWLSGESRDNKIDYAIIKNGSIGVCVDSTTSSNSNLTIYNTIIANMSQYGILATQSRVIGANLVIGNCQTALSLQQGGKYDFTQCTFTNYYAKNPSGAFSLSMSDYVIRGTEKQSYVFENANFVNCIFYGNNTDQILFDFVKAETKPYYFDHCILRQNIPNPGNLFSSCRFNTNPLFKDTKGFNFEIDTISSPTVHAGNSNGAIGVAEYDIKGIRRSGLPTIGAYEFVEKLPGKATSFPFLFRRPRS